MEKFNITVGRYRGLLISIVVFLLLIGLLLVFTFFASTRLEQNTALVNEANYVANDAQSVIKDLFDLQNSYGESIRSPHMQRVLTRLKADSEHITYSLDTIREGGAINNDFEGKSDRTEFDYVLPEIDDQALIDDIQAAKTEWLKLEPKIKAYLANARDITMDSSDELTLAVDQAKTSSLLINTALAKLSTDVMLESQSEADSIRRIQVLGVLVIFIYFLIFVLVFIRRLGQSDQEVLEARRGTEEIMETVNTGLFLLDRDLMIGSQHSKALVDIMGTSRLAGYNFTSVLRNRVSDKDLETTRQFIEQLYNPRVKSKLVNDLNPLNKVMLHNNDSNSSASDSYLDFKFSRVYEGKDIARILVNVSDVSDAVLLENRLEKEREQNDLQIEMLTTILNVSPKLINDFIKNTNIRIESINTILKNPGNSQFELENKLKSIYREVHSLKGEASALKLHSFTSIATEAEDKLHSLQNQGRLSGNDFLPLAVHLDDLLSLSNTIDTLGHRINQAANGAIGGDFNKNATTFTTTAQPSQNQSGTTPESTDSSETILDVINIEEDISQEAVVAEKVKYYKEFVEDVAVRQQKRVNLVTAGLEIAVADDLEVMIREIRIQLIRNAIVHGIETPDIRSRAGKNPVGTLQLLQKQQGNSLILVFEDDGAGINYGSIRKKLISMGHYNELSAADLTNPQLLNALFSSGFSTKDTTDEDGGRGVGLDIIKDRVKTLNGKINVHSEEGKLTRFTIALPL